MRRKLLIALVVVGVVLGLPVLAGLLMPREHHAVASARIPGPPDAVFAAIRDVARYADWRSDVDRVELLPDDGRGARFREHSGSDAVTYRIEQSDPPKLLRVRIDDDALPFSGSWTYEVRPLDSDTMVTITEDGAIDNPVLRLIARLFFSPTETMERYLADLDRSRVR
jgi:uncharacterized protein YndB with AHSA1/START domain